MSHKKTKKISKGRRARIGNGGEGSPGTSFHFKQCSTPDASHNTISASSVSESSTLETDVYTLLVVLARNDDFSAVHIKVVNHLVICLYIN